MCNYENSGIGTATQYADMANAKTVAGSINNPARYQRPSLVEELEKQQYAAMEQSERTSRALNFLRANPAFDEFITLVRTGCIGI